MRVEKEKRKVSIICQDNLLVEGYIHINPGERVIDFFNDTRESFIAITNAEFSNLKEIKSFKLIEEMLKKQNAVILNKETIKLVEEI
jgi:hypothetical protein